MSCLNLYLKGNAIGSLDGCMGCTSVTFSTATRSSAITEVPRHAECIKREFITSWLVVCIHDVHDVWDAQLHPFHREEGVP